MDLSLSFKDFDLNYFSGTHMSCTNPNCSIVLEAYERCGL